MDSLIIPLRIFLHNAAGPWASLVILGGSGPSDPGSNPGGPKLFFFLSDGRKKENFGKEKKARFRSPLRGEFQRLVKSVFVPNKAQAGRFFGPSRLWRARVARSSAVRPDPSDDMHSSLPKGIHFSSLRHDPVRQNQRFSIIRSVASTQACFTSEGLAPINRSAMSPR